MTGRIIDALVQRSALCIFGCALAFGQSAPGPAFEVASVKLSPPIPPNGRAYFGPPRGGPGTPDPSQITWAYANLRALLMTAYDVKEYQIGGAPAWIDSQRYDIIAKVPPGATKEQVSMMWQNLLAERFHLALHHESKEFQVEELVIAKSGSKLKETTVDPAALLDPGPPKFNDKTGELGGPGYVTTLRFTGEAHSAAKAQTLSALTARLGNMLRRPVLDKTGLTGKYDFSLDFRIDPQSLGLPPPGPGAPAPADSADLGPDLATAVQQQLGLRLVAAKANLDVLVIDKIDKTPTEN
jgi:uncharacterized protein (TIGR03435 family)